MTFLLLYTIVLWLGLINAPQYGAVDNVFIVLILSSCSTATLNHHYKYLPIQTVGLPFLFKFNLDSNAVWDGKF